MKTEWLVSDVTSVGSPDRAECVIYFEDGFRRFWPIQAIFVVGEPLCDTIGIHCRALMTALRIIY